MGILPEGHFSLGRRQRMQQSTPDTYFEKSAYGSRPGEVGYRANLVASSYSLGAVHHAMDVHSYDSKKRYQL